MPKRGRGRPPSAAVATRNREIRALHREWRPKVALEKQIVSALAEEFGLTTRQIARILSEETDRAIAPDRDRDPEVSRAAWRAIKEAEKAENRLPRWQESLDQIRKLNGRN